MGAPGGERRDAVAIIGVGLIGGSIGLALRARGLATRVVGVGRDEGRLAQAVAAGAIDEATTTLEEAAAGASVVVACTPVDRIADDLARVAAAAPDCCLLTDAGSTKAGIVARLEASGGIAGRFVGAHPIAGSERSGVAAARADLFEGAVCVLTPGPSSRADMVERANRFWADLGCRIVSMEPDRHDALLAVVSHLPHAAAAALAGLADAEARGVAGGAFRDGTRVAGADAALWSSIFVENRAAVLDALGRYRWSLDQFCELLEAGDADGLTAWWRAAQHQRSAES